MISNNKHTIYSDSFQSDTELSTKLIKGDADAFAALFRKYYELLYQFAGRFVKDPQTSESIVQDVFVKIWENKTKLELKSNIKSYLYAAVKNQSLNYLRREQFVVHTLNDVESEPGNNREPGKELDRKEIIEAVHKAIEKLPFQRRQIFIMKKFENLTYEEIADIQNISINTVKTQMKRALQSLRQNLSYLLSILFFSN